MGGAPGGYKLVIRLFVIVTTFEPMSVHIMPDGPMFYTRGPHSLKDKSWKSRSNFITDYFFTHAQAEHGTTLSILRTRYIKGIRGDDDIELWRKIKHASVKTLMPLAWRLGQQESQLLPYDRGAYHIFGYDISVNSHVEPVVIEVNGHPMTDLEIVKTNETHKRPVVQADREAKMDMIDRIGSLLGFYDESNGKQEADVRKLVDEKAKKFGWERCDEEPGVVLPKKNGKLCLTPQGLKDVVWSELEMIRKGPFECAFPLENGRNVVHLLDGKLPRSERLVEWWEESKALGKGSPLFEHAHAMERKPAYFAPKVTKKYERDMY